MDNYININEILKMIPHRYPFLLIDRVLELEPLKNIKALKNVTINEPYFMGHFPNNPVMPGVLIIETMAQASAVLVSKSLTNSDNKDVFFLAIEEAKFRKVVKPGDSMYIYAKIQQNRNSVWKFSSLAKVEGEIVAESKFTAMVKNKDK